MPANDDRYDRHLRLPHWGKAAQEKLAGAHVLQIGCGGLGSHAADLLVRAGLGELTLVDPDVVEPSNLPRQTLYTEADALQHAPKVQAAAEHLRAIDSACRIHTVQRWAGAEDLAEWSERVDLVLDGADNPATRYRINEACVRHGTPFVHAGLDRMDGVVMAVIPGRTACYACLHPERDEVVAEAAGSPVWSPLVSLVASVQAHVALMILGGRPEEVVGLVAVDLAGMRWHRRFLMPEPACPCCGRSDQPGNS